MNQLRSAEPRYVASLRTPRIGGFEWLAPQDDLDEQIYRDVLSEGCSILSFAGEGTSPEFTYSVGLYLNFLHPEILLMGLHPSTAHSIIGQIRDDAEKGVMTNSSSARSDLFEDGRPVRFIPVPNDLYLGYLGRNCSFYLSLFLLPPASHDHRFPVLQAIWPDRNGRYPDEVGCDPRLVAIHKLAPQSHR